MAVVMVTSVSRFVMLVNRSWSNIMADGDNGGALRTMFMTDRMPRVVRAQRNLQNHCMRPVTPLLGSEPHTDGAV